VRQALLPSEESPIAFLCKLREICGAVALGGKGGLFFMDKSVHVAGHALGFRLGLVALFDESGNVLVQFISLGANFFNIAHHLILSRQ
jgi:hypothetical protein